MAGSVDLPMVVALDKIRAEGERRGYEGEELEDFVNVLRGVDDEFVRVNVHRTLAEFHSAVSRIKHKR
jgi:hypothetical protein